MRSNRFWIAVLGGVILISVIAALLIMLAPASHARIYLDGELIEELDLSAVAEPYEILVESRSGYNIITVEHGRIRVSGANCHDGSCLRQGWVSDGLLPVVCLPHRLVIRLESGSDPEIDAVTR